MDLLLCVPGGKPIGALYEQIVEKGYEGVRIDLPDSHKGATEVLRELAERPHVKAVVLIAGGKMRRDHPAEGGPAWKPGELVAHVQDTMVKAQDLGLLKRAELPVFEIGNEPDLACDEWKKKPELLADTFGRCYEVVRKYSRDCDVLSPSVSNLNDRGFAYLERMVKAGLPLGCDLAVHRYPNGPSFEIPHEGFASRLDELRKLEQLAGGRPIWITEVGMREGPHGYEGDDDFYMTESEVADAFEWEMTYWGAVPQVQAACWYQINSGADRKNELHNYGARRLSGEWKPVADRVAAVRAKLEASA